MPTVVTAGRELDALIAEKVMGLHVCQLEVSNVEDACAPRAYSTDIAAAWLIVEKLRESGTVKLKGCPGCEDSTGPHWYCETPDQENALAETAPLAICLAALAWAESRFNLTC